jgi:hypothetical protein
MELVYRFAACFASELRAAAASQAVEKAKTKALLDYMLQQRFEVHCIDNGQTYPAQMCFVPTTLAEVLQVRWNQFIDFRVLCRRLDCSPKETCPK